MLEGLDQVDWQTITHAYGPALDVPAQIRDLVSANRNLREKALHDLYGNIWHQGSIYEATVYAVPFLFELVESEDVQDKHEVLIFLARLATGHSYHDVHQHISFLASATKTPERFVQVKGRVQNHDGVVHLRAERIWPLSVSAAATQSHDFH